MNGLTHFTSASLILAAMSFHGSPAHAADADCTLYSALSATGAGPSLGTITGTGHVLVTPPYLPPGRAAPYLLPGDEVIVLATADARTCIVFTAPNRGARQTAGWVAAGSVSAADPAPGAGGWVGEWRSGPEESVSLAPAGDRIAVKGEASFGATDPARVASGGVNIGSLEGFVTPAAGQADYADGATADDCHVRFWRRGPYLVAADNGNCGGHNVTFTGVYRRVGSRTG
jgi:hypothetical protein